MPSTAWWKSNTVEDGERGHTLSHSSKKAGLTHSHTVLLLHAFLQPFTHSRVPWGTGAHSPMCALSEMINLCSQPFKPTNKSEHAHVYGWNPQRALWVKRTALSSPLPLLSFFAASSKRPGRWITTPLPEGKNRSSHFKTKSKRFAPERAA